MTFKHRGVLSICFKVQKIEIFLPFFREQSKKKIGRQMELAGSNLTEDQLEDMLDKGEGAQLVGHVHIEGDADQLRKCSSVWRRASLNCTTCSLTLPP